MPALGLALGLSRVRPLANVAPFVGPFDAFAADLGLMLLPFRGLSSYAGDAFTIRDTSGDAEQEVGFDATGELAAFTVGGSAAVRRWRDQSGNDNHLPQSSAAAQPLLAAALNGQVVRFDGSNDELILPQPALAGDERTVYVVVRARSNGGNGRAWDDGAGGSSSVFFDDITSGTYQYYLTGNVVDPVGGTPGAWNVMVLRYSKPSGYLCEPFINGAVGTPFVSAGHASGGLCLASGNGNSFGPVDIAARLDFTAAHDDPTRSAIEAILASKFGITL